MRQAVSDFGWSWEPIFRKLYLLNFFVGRSPCLKSGVGFVVNLRGTTLNCSEGPKCLRLMHQHEIVCLESVEVVLRGSGACGIYDGLPLACQIHDNHQQRDLILTSPCDVGREKHAGTCTVDCGPFQVSCADTGDYRDLTAVVWERSNSGLRHSLAIMISLLEHLV